MVRREIAPTSQALQVAFSRLFREPMLSESTSFGSRWGIYEMGSSHLEGEPCLSRATDTSEGQQLGHREGPLDLHQLALASDEAGSRDGRIVPSANARGLVPRPASTGLDDEFHPA